MNAIAESVESRSVAVYTGPGSSNSWIWLADFLERNKFLNARFEIDPEHITGSDIIVVPGGDTFGISRAFGIGNLQLMKNSIRGGTGYLGICAGAYLPLRSSIPPLSEFNLLDTRVANISSSVPRGIKDVERYSIRYGCSVVFHPVRGPVVMEGDSELVAPIYGGPPMIPSGHEKAILTFKGFGEDAEMLVERELIERSFIGRAACVEGRYGDGKVVCSAVHLEHPDYPDANELLIRLLRAFPSKTRRANQCQDEFVGTHELRGALADLRVVASSLESRSWKIGLKYWESEKLLFYIDAIRRRIGRDEKSTAPRATMESLRRAMRDLRSFKQGGDESLLDSAVNNLSSGASSFLTAHFQKLREN